MALLLGVSALASAFALSVMSANAQLHQSALRSVRIPGQMYAIGCMTASLCMTAGIGQGQGQPTEVRVLRNGKIIRSLLLKNAGRGNVAGISCPSSRGCVVAAPLFSTGSTALTTVNSAGAIRTRTLPASHGASFNSISCATIHSCQLAGASATDIAVASWNGTRIAVTTVLSPPVNSGFSNYLPQSSCAGAWCEVSINLQRISQQGSAGRVVGYLITTHPGKPVGSRWTSGYQILDISCSADSGCPSILDRNSSTGSSPHSFLAVVDHGKIPTPTPLTMNATALACRGDMCSIIGSDTIATYVSGRQRIVRTVKSVRDFLGVSTRPGGVFGAVGVAHGPGSIVATG